MNTADICFLVFAALLTVVGIFKGFIKMIIDLFSGLIAFAAAILLARPIAAALGGLSYFDPSRERIREFLVKHASGVSDTVADAVNGLQVPGFIRDLILRDAGDPSALLSSGAAALAGKVFTVMLTAAVFLVIMVLIRIVFFLLERSIEGIFRRVRVLKTTNRILGGAFGLVNALFITYVILAIIAMTASNFPGTVKLLADSAIAGKLFYNNLLLQLIA